MLAYVQDLEGKLQFKLTRLVYLIAVGFFLSLKERTFMSTSHYTSWIPTRSDIETA